MEKETVKQSFIFTVYRSDDRLGVSLCPHWALIPVNDLVASAFLRKFARMMRQTSAIAAAIILMLTMMAVACTSTPKRTSAVFYAADSLMDSRPDSALALLDGIAADTAHMSKGDLMRYYLLRANALNKCDTVFRADHTALMHRVCDFYDHGGSPNDRMLAHYLLGRCYADMGEAPAALKEYMHAESLADTTSTNCDYILLSNLCFQNASLLLYQMVLPEAVAYYGKAMHYAYEGGDTLRAVSCYENKAIAYLLKNEPDSVALVCERAMDMYRQCGHEEYAYNSVPLLANVLIDEGKADLAGALLNDYESKSGLFDAQGNIEPGREIYYYYKGMYLLSCSRYEEARILFMKLQSFSIDGNNVEAAAKGLLGVYKHLHQADSIAKYAELYCSANDSSYKRIHVDEMVRAKASFDFSRMERTASMKTIEAEHAKSLVLLLVTVVSILVAIFLLAAAWRWKKDKETKLRHVLLNNRYNALLKKHVVLEEQLRESDSHYQSLLDKYQHSQKLLADMNVRHQKETESLRNHICELDMQLSAFMTDITGQDGQWHSEKLMLHLTIVRELHEKAANLHVATEKDWVRLQSDVSKNMPGFFQQISEEEHALTPSEIQLAMLVRLGFIIPECCILMDKRSQRITNMRNNLNKKLFGAKGAKSLDYNIKSL